MTDVVLIRGTPGSGKTTYAKQKYPGHDQSIPIAGSGKRYGLTRSD